MLTAARIVETLALGLWLGSMVFLSFVVAPAAFAVLPSRELAGQLVGHTLARLYLLGYVCGALFLLALVVEQRLSGASLRAVALPIGLLAAMLLLIFCNQYFLGERLAALRTEMTATFGSIDQTPRDHALRAAFGRYHGVSAVLMSANMLLTLVLFVLTVRRFR